MDEREKKRIIGSVDIAVAIFIVITGFLVIIFSVSWGDWLSSTYTTMQPAWLDKTTWIITFIGITTTVYGIKRIVQDLIY